MAASDYVPKSLALGWGVHSRSANAMLLGTAPRCLLAACSLVPWHIGSAVPGLF
jgi:hypothetical protein